MRTPGRSHPRSLACDSRTLSGGTSRGKGESGGVMSDVALISLQHALTLTVEMIDAAAHGNWTLVTELDERRQFHLQQLQAATLDSHHHEMLQALQTQNQK